MAAEHGSHDAQRPPTTAHELTSRVATTDDGTTICTIYPPRVETQAQTTTWISAEEGSYVDAAEYR